MSSENLMKTILCSRTDNSYGTTSGVEYVKLLYPLFGKYFDRILNHREDIYSLLDNTMYVYCGMPLNYQIEKTVFIPKSIGNYEYIAFFDMSGISLSSNDDNLTKVTAIKFDKRFIGYYIEDRNILITCDMSHSEEDIELTKYIYDDLVSLLELKPLIPQKLIK